MTQNSDFGTFFYKHKQMYQITVFIYTYYLTHLFLLLRSAEMFLIIFILCVSPICRRRHTRLFLEQC